MEIKELLEDKIISFTDKYLYYPCLSDRDKIEYPDYVIDGKTIFIPIAQRSYLEVATNLYEALTGEKINLFTLPNNDRRILYDTITNDVKYQCVKKMLDDYYKD